MATPCTCRGKASPECFVTAHFWAHGAGVGACCLTMALHAPAACNACACSNCEEPWLRHLFFIARPTIEENEEETEDEKADAAPDDDEGKAQERIA